MYVHPQPNKNNLPPSAQSRKTPREAGQVAFPSVWRRIKKLRTRQHETRARDSRAKPHREMFSEAKQRKSNPLLFPSDKGQRATENHPDIQYTSRPEVPRGKESRCLMSPNSQAHGNHGDPAARFSRTMRSDWPRAEDRSVMS